MKIKIKKYKNNNKYNKIHKFILFLNTPMLPDVANKKLKKNIIKKIKYNKQFFSYEIMHNLLEIF